MSPDTLAEFAAILALLGTLYAAVRRLLPWGRQLVHFLDDITGEMARKGSPARPGLLERQTAIEARIADIQAAVQELRPDHGASVKDQLTRIEVQTTALQMVLDQHLALATTTEAEIRAAIRELQRKLAS